MSNAITRTLTQESYTLFMDLAEDALEWSGQPPVDITKEQRGNLTDLKRKGLIVTETEMLEMAVGGKRKLEWVQFTAKGIEYAKQLGFDLSCDLSYSPR